MMLLRPMLMIVALPTDEHRQGMANLLAEIYFRSNKSIHKLSQAIYNCN